MRPGDLSYNAIFLNVTRFVIILCCCKCVFQLSAVSLKCFCMSVSLPSGQNVQYIMTYMYLHQ